MHTHICVYMCLEVKELINDPNEKRKFTMRVVEKRLYFISYDFNAVGSLFS